MAPSRAAIRLLLELSFKARYPETEAASVWPFRELCQHPGVAGPINIAEQAPRLCSQDRARGDVSSADASGGSVSSTIARSAMTSASFGVISNVVSRHVSASHNSLASSRSTAIAERKTQPLPKVGVASSRFSSISVHNPVRAPLTFVDIESQEARVVREWALMGTVSSRGRW